jgi:hypothetical protein
MKDGDGRLSKAIHYNRLQICKSQKIKIKHITKLAEETQHEFNQPEDNFQYTQSLRKEISVIAPVVVKLPDIIEEKLVELKEEVEIDEEEEQLSGEEGEQVSEGLEERLSEGELSEDEEQSSINGSAQNEVDIDTEEEQTIFSPGLIVDRRQLQEPIIRKSTRRSNPPEKFIVGQPNPRIKKNK